jgi:hypothetical protein
MPPNALGDVSLVSIGLTREPRGFTGIMIAIGLST